jgi:hypothetical protein
MSLTPEQVAQKLWAATWGSRNHAPTDADKAYWTPDFWNALDAHGENEMHPPHLNYAYDRAIGWQSTGADVPPYGPYANPPSALMPVPPYPGTEPTPTPTPTPVPTPEPVVPVSVLGDIVEQLAAVKATTDMTLLTVQALVALITGLKYPPYSGKVSVPFVGDRTITLTPVK